MRKMTATCLALVSALVLGACGETVNIGENGVAQGITVQATGTADVVPDAVRLSLSVSVLAESNDVALSGAANTSENVRSALTDLGIDAADVATQTVTVNPEYSYTESEGQKIVGYRASQVFDVLIRDAAMAGAVIDAVVAAGGANVSINYTSPVVDDATVGAVAAREDAVARLAQKPRNTRNSSMLNSATWCISPKCRHQPTLWSVRRLMRWQKAQEPSLISAPKK